MTRTSTTSGSYSSEIFTTSPRLSELHCYTETEGVITTTMFDLPGYKVVRVLGTVYGLTVRSRDWAVSLSMVIKSIAGGDLRWFTSVVCHLTK
ncbi:putative upf0145 domain-containing protein [Eutypa lata UCREL1]|uniref:Putative upf0145 domain-containing protein n=1 Tax=Eutypa lata (strain UCR-EL1) TaxID=1287681 RepID=M7SP24_EUTLA|nr:putative upf0145 domain-containing protein [Eutypa lata UCREL1]